MTVVLVVTAGHHCLPSCHQAVMTVRPGSHVKDGLQNKTILFDNHFRAQLVEFVPQFLGLKAALDIVELFTVVHGLHNFDRLLLICIFKLKILDNC